MDLELTQILNTRSSRTQARPNSTMEKLSHLMVSKRSEFTSYMQSNMRQVQSKTCCRWTLTKEPVESIYSGVVSLRSLRMVVFLSQLNNLEIWGADVGNAYLEAYTDEKLCIMAGPEFKELQGHLLIMSKPCTGLVLGEPDGMTDFLTSSKS